MKIDHLSKTIRHLEQSNQQLWDKFNCITEELKENCSRESFKSIPELGKVAPLEKTYLHFVKQESKSAPRVSVTETCKVASSPYVPEIFKLESSNPTNYQFSPMLLELKK